MNIILYFIIGILLILNIIQFIYIRRLKKRVINTLLPTFRRIYPNEIIKDLFNVEPMPMDELVVYKKDK